MHIEVGVSVEHMRGILIIMVCVTEATCMLLCMYVVHLRVGGNCRSPRLWRDGKMGKRRPTDFGILNFEWVQSIEY
jgi:hypothetical protein